MTFIESVREKSRLIWKLLVRNSVVLVLLASIATAFFGLFLLVGGGYVLGTFKTSSQLLATSIAIAVGCVIFALSMLGCVSVATRKPGFILFYTALCILLFIAEFIFACYLLSLVYSINAVNDAKYSQLLTSELDKNANDYIYSMYATCCTGCSVAVCGADSTAPASTGLCIQDNPIYVPCQWVQLCPTLNSTATPSIPSCFFNKSKRGNLPTFTVGEDVCALLKTAAWGSFGKPIVGSPGGAISEGRSCGGGDPKGLFCF